MGAAVAVYFLCKEPLGTQATSWLCILSAIPFALLGFVRYNGMNAEQLAGGLGAVGAAFARAVPV